MLVGAGVSLSASSAAAAVALPSACAVLPSAEVVSTTGYKPAALHPRETSQTADGGPLHTCTYKRGKLRLTLLLTPAAQYNNGFSGSPGLVIKKEPIFGSKGVLLYDNEPKYQFVTVSFVSKGYFIVISSSGIPKAKILRVGKYAYANP
jgi:hypothetical protein